MSLILVLNGPNLNLLGTREPSLYGTTTLAELEATLQKQAQQLGHELIFTQRNGEGELINDIQLAKRQGAEFMIINAAAYTHTSIALRDALLSVAIPFIEIHLSNLFKREPYRHHSYLSDIAIGLITGLGVQGYEFALSAANQILTQSTQQK